jgi:UDP-N-acetylglucosamine:LPS N-acetylglucosamine transferase
LLTQEINSIIQNQEKYQAMSKAARNFYLSDAAKKISGILLSIGREHE